MDFHRLLPFITWLSTRAYFRRLSNEQAWLIVIALMFPSSIMPMASSVVRVASPLFRDTFQASTENLAWLSMSFTIPYMVLMPVYSRLSEMVGRRRLILAGIAVFLVGTCVAMLAPRLWVLMVGQALQGFGSAGLMPLAMAYIAAIFERHERGKALGTWSSVGPAVAWIGPLLAGILISQWDWRVTYILPMVTGILSIIVVARAIPPGMSNIQPHMWRRFDWTGVGLLAVFIICFFAYLSSRPITGVAPLQDWRLGLASVVPLATLLWWERRIDNPFLDLNLYRSKLFRQASLGAALRMVTMGCTSLLVPLFLVDMFQVDGVTLGLMLMINPAAMSLMVRFGGTAADQFGSGKPLMVGFALQIAVMLSIYRSPLPQTLLGLGFLLAVHGLGMGLMLASLHRIALLDVNEANATVAAGMYSFVRFIGVAIGVAVAGVIFQGFTDAGVEPVLAYRQTFGGFAVAATAGLALSFVIKDPGPSHA